MMRGLVGLATVAFFFAACGGSEEGKDASPSETPQSGAPAAEAPSDVQIVQVRVEGNAYVFTPATVQAGKPVRLVFDPNALPGCSRDVTLPEFDIAKVISPGDATIDFTPRAEGPVAVACSMDMYRGTLVADLGREGTKP